MLEALNLEKIYNDTVENGIDSAIKENKLPENSYVEYLNEYNREICQGSFQEWS